MNNNYSQLFTSLTNSIDGFVNEVKNIKSTLMATDEWTVKDELCHIVFWHENYVANYRALSKGETPPLPEGMSTINMAGVLSLRKFTIKELIYRLYEANELLYKYIVKERIPRMTYSKRRSHL